MPAGTAIGPAEEFPNLPEATIARLPEYLRALHHFSEAGNETVSSEALAAAAGVNSAKLRKDLSHLGSYGTRGVGYDVAVLVDQIESVLGLTRAPRGRLGRRRATSDTRWRGTAASRRADSASRHSSTPTRLGSVNASAGS
jgi:hypothetical protein